MVGNPTFIAVTPDGKFAVVANRDDPTFAIIDIAGRRIQATVPAGCNLDMADIAITPDSVFALVVNGVDHQITVLALGSAQVVTLPMSAVPQGIAITPDGKNALVTTQNSAIMI